jgi:signal transduction histidine kinase/CheY-like chemotaxis protein
VFEDEEIDIPEVKADRSSLNQEFNRERLTIINHAVMKGAILCSILVPLFGLLDLVFKPYMVATLYTIRFFVTLACIAIFYGSKAPFGKKYPYQMTFLLVLFVCGSIALMTHLDMGSVDPYYAGINLPLVGLGIMFPFTLWEGIITLSSVWLIYFIPNLILMKPDQITLFLNNNFFLISTIIISLVGTQFNLQHRKNQWASHRRLRLAHRKIKSHAKELEEKVKERTQRLLQSERLAVVGQLAGGVAHDFNNILTAILGISQLLLDSLPKGNPIREDIESICRVGRRAVDLVKQLLAFSRRQILRPKLLNLNDVIQDVEKMLHRLIGEDIELIVKTAPNLGSVMADPVQIEQIILNLSVNARDAMPHGGSLIIQTANVTLDQAYCKLGKTSLVPGDYVMLSTSDTGSGMPDEIKAKIFEPFFTTKEPGQGTGLGLSTVYGIVKQSNGDILVYSEPDKGTTMKIFLPRQRESAVTEVKEEKSASGLPRGKETILLVEDEEEVRKLTARMLKKQGYKVMQAGEGREALSIADNYKDNIDLLVTDVIMPHMSGKDLAENLTSERSNIKVLFISGHNDSMMMHHGINAAHVAFLQKPYTIESLSHKIRHVFDN